MRAPMAVLARLAILCLGMTAGALAIAQGMTVTQREALTAAEVWLARVDKQQYADAWSAAAEPFRTSVTRQAFSEGAPKLRKDFGKVASRKGEKLAYVGEHPDHSDPTGAAKPGMQIAIHFDTTFAGKKKAVEEVTMLLESDGIWRPVGYYIQ